jgi:hypothetical protein
MVSRGHGKVRPAAVAGRFYPGEAAALAAEVDEMLAAAPATSGPRPKALIVPHAGYVYSGPIAASAYKLLMQHPRPTRVVLIGPAHYVGLRGLALPDATAVATPLGVIDLDGALMARARGAAAGVCVGGGARARALARGPAAVPAASAGVVHAGPAGGGARGAGGGRGGC